MFFTRTSRTLSLVSLTSLFALAVPAAGCAGEESVSPTIQLVDRTSQALSTGSLTHVNGTYQDCESRIGNWSARISGADPMTYDAVSVVKGDAACRLVVTGLVGTDAYAAAPSITMVSAYAATASAFAPDGQPTAFYGNAKLDALTYQSAFVMTILFSDDLADSDSATSASFASVSSTASESQVPAPDYALTFDGFAIQTDIDQVVQSATGAVTATATEQTGELYVVSSNALLGSSFADIDAEFALGNAAALGAPLPASAFDLEGATLPAVRNLIMVHTVSGVSAYEVIRITFQGAPVIP